MKRFLRTTAWSLFILFVLGAGFVGVLVAAIYPDLPSIEAIRDMRLKEPLRIYTIDGHVMAEFGSEKRISVRIEEAPQTLIDAILAAEDHRYFDHHGVDISGIARAALANLRTGSIDQGASTITMQVARNYFLTREKTYSRKFREALLAFKLERTLSKEQILELYLNKIFLGHRAYGFQAAASIYYDKRLDELSLPQLAMLAGLPKAPSTSNPVTGTSKAKTRRDYVLRRMHELNMISSSIYDGATETPLSARKHVAKIAVDSPYVAEMVRSYMVNRYGQDAYVNGYRVFTTITLRYQAAATLALRNGLLAYDRRHGYRGPIDRITEGTDSDQSRLNTLRLSTYRRLNNLEPGVVIRTSPNLLEVVLADSSAIRMKAQSWSWTGRTPDQILHAGDVVYVHRSESGNFLSQFPQIQGALVSLAPTDGAILALVGGFDFFSGKFNRATQARRQPGSSIKPFIYSAALENGFTAASLVSGAPVVVESVQGDLWRPQNYSKKVLGPTRLRKALSLSINLVSVRLVRAMGINLVLDHLENFGFSRSQLPDGLSLALGSADLTPLEVARGYAVFANGGYLVQPYFIARVEDQSGAIIEYSNRIMACPNCKLTEKEKTQSGAEGIDPRYARRVLTPENSFIMDSLMRQVIQTGTGRQAGSLGRRDLAGKTGTTNNFRDAWFSGYNRDIVTSVWVGFDQPRNLGQRESGAKAALPIWMDYMSSTLADKPDVQLRQPENIIRAFVNRKTGQPARRNDPEGYEEIFVMGTEPQARLSDRNPVNGSAGYSAPTLDELF